MQEYPRPDFLHGELDFLNWKSLNGVWDFVFDDYDIGLSNAWQLDALPSDSPPKRQIQVPFVFQSKASGINEQGTPSDSLLLRPSDQSNQVLQLLSYVQRMNCTFHSSKKFLHFHATC